MATGEAAGVTASIALKKGIPVAEVNATDVQSVLSNRGIKLFD